MWITNERRIHILHGGFHSRGGRGWKRYNRLPSWITGQVPRETRRRLIIEKSKRVGQKKKREQSRFETNLDTHSRGDATRPRDSIDRSSSIQVSRFTRSLPFQSLSVFPPCSKGVGSRDNFLGDREDRSRVVVPGESFARWNATRTTLASVTRVGGYKLRFYRS